MRLALRRTCEITLRPSGGSGNKVGDSLVSFATLMHQRIRSAVARAKGMAQVARNAGLGRESLYKALAPGAKPRFDTVMRVARALGVKFTAQPA